MSILEQKLCRSAFQLWAISGVRGLSVSGFDIIDRIERRTSLIFNWGLHCSLSLPKSRHPLSCTLGWYNFVVNFTWVLEVWMDNHLEKITSKRIHLLGRVYLRGLKMISKGSLLILDAKITKNKIKIKIVACQWNRSSPTGATLQVMGGSSRISCNSVLSRLFTATHCCNKLNYGFPRRSSSKKNGGSEVGGAIGFERWVAVVYYGISGWYEGYRVVVVSMLALQQYHAGRSDLVLTMETKYGATFFFDFGV